MSRTGEGIREGWSRGWSVFGRRAAAALSANVSRHVVFTPKANVFYFGAALIGSLMGTLLLARYSWFWSPFNADSMVAVGVVLTAGTLALASVAGGIALVAYVTVAWPPTLRVTVRSLIWPVDQPEIVYDPRGVRAADNLSADEALEYERDVIRDSGLTGLDIAGELTIRIQNTSQFSARSPACRVSTYGFRGLHWERGAEGDTWSRLGPGEGADDRVQWDGGANFVVHGNWSRDIHLSADRTLITKPTGSLMLELVADGYRKRWPPIPVKFLSPAEFVQRHPKLEQRVSSGLRNLHAPSALSAESSAASRGPQARPGHRGEG